MRFLPALALLAVIPLCLAHPATAENIPFYRDPVYQKIAGEDSHPMEDLLVLAQKGDPRAQYILGDLYGKGKGGLGISSIKSRYWFETAALNGYSMGFIRLAAQAKNKRDYVSAYKWYTLNISDSSGDESKWASRSRDEIEKKGWLSKNGVREAREAANSWRAKREKERADRRAKEREALRLAEEKAKKKAAKKTAASKKGKKGKTAKQETQEKEFHYND